MWATILHLFLGNAIIGLIEGLLLGQIFKCSKWKSVLLLIAANYASAWAGAFLIGNSLASLPDLTIQTIQIWLLIFIIAMFVVTLLVEFPFFWFALQSKNQSLRKAFVATPLIHGISYTLLLGWYLMASGTSMMSKLKVVSAAEMTHAESYALYFISREGNRILQMDLNEPDSTQEISEIVAHHRNDRLFVRARSGSGFDLFIHLHSTHPEPNKEKLILEDFSDRAAVEWRIAEGKSEESVGTWISYGPVPSIASQTDWEFRTGFWASGGISGENTKTGARVQYSLELPFAAWAVRNAIHLENDYLVAQLGDDQICLLHPDSGRIALVARGKGPIVATKRSANKPTYLDPALSATESSGPDKK
ncbi:MAG: hypothetical protein AAGA58_04325 [Verrucomicrobiota bacterium]